MTGVAQAFRPAKERQMIRLASSVGFIGLLATVIVGQEQSKPAIRFEISVPASARAEATTGRV